MQIFTFYRSPVAILLCTDSIQLHASSMGMRREARERAVQFLFQHDMNRPDKLEEALDHFWHSQRPAEGKPSRETGHEAHEEDPKEKEQQALRSFADPLIRGTLEHLDQVDALIRQYAKNWRLERIAVVDRNILRLALYEMTCREDIPPVVSINEAVDIAKKFSTAESGKFVNGLLDRAKADLMRSARTATDPVKTMAR